MNIEDIQNNEYIRTKNGRMAKVINNQYYMQQYIETDNGTVLRENIVNHSKNKIDLVRAGDYVNGHLVIEKSNELNDDGEVEISLESDHIIYHYIKENDIKSIVTSEQFSSVEYVF